MYYFAERGESSKRKSEKELQQAQLNKDLVKLDEEEKQKAQEYKECMLQIKTKAEEYRTAEKHLRDMDDQFWQLEWEDIQK